MWVDSGEEVVVNVCKEAVIDHDLESSQLCKLYAI